MLLSDHAQDLLFREAHTTYGFTGEPVADDEVRAVYDLVKYGPTAMNSQPLRVVLIRSDEARERLTAHMAPGNKPKIGKAPLVAVLAADLDFHHELPKVFPANPTAKDGFERDEAARVATAKFNAGLQTAYFIVGLRAAGLAAGPMGGFDADGLSKEFFPEGDHHAVAVVNIGRRAENDSHHPRQHRLDYDEVVTVV
ncbi:malonic semialdehyde reductase [Nonomuraea sp. NPDC049152]|uniref:malonic semialdehyde reductase n=1 Tax=Nonomuraea sp. NPDC049152 TaxID=3154350 RepID=UPI00340A281D